MAATNEFPPCPTPLEQVIQDALCELERCRYSPLTVGRYRSDWKKLVIFAKEGEFPPCFSDDLAEAFLQSHGIRLAEMAEPPNSRQRHIVSHVRRLADFGRDGCFRFVGHRRHQDSLPPPFESILEEYLSFLTRELRIRSTSLRVRSSHGRAFLHFLDARGVRALGEISGRILSEFHCSQVHLKPVSLAGIASDLRGFLRFLFMRGVLPDDLSPLIPRIRIWRHDRLPSVWTPEQVEAILAVVDRSSPVGKRNYVIVLLACRLGLRAGDIRTLRLQDLHWDEARIVIRQSKTQEPLVLPLTQEIGEALIDYLQHGRPKSDHREVFLGAHAPYAPFGPNNNLYNIVTNYRRLAGIKVPRQGHWGLHSLRHTLASRLLQQGTPLPVISEILGHRTSESTQVYIKVDLPALRSAAVDPEEVFRD